MIRNNKTGFKFHAVMCLPETGGASHCFNKAFLSLILAVAVCACFGLQVSAETPDREVLLENYNMIDLSHHNKRSNYAKFITPKTEYVYLKASEGRSFRDPEFENYRKEFKERGLKTGAYHFMHFGSSGRENFENYMGATNGKIDLSPVLDLEMWSFGKNPRKMNRDEVNQAIREFCENCREKLGEYPILYVRKEFYEKYLSGEDYYDGMRFWMPVDELVERVEPVIFQTIKKEGGTSIDVNLVLDDINFPRE